MADPEEHARFELAHQDWKSRMPPTTSMFQGVSCMVSYTMKKCKECNGSLPDKRYSYCPSGPCSERECLRCGGPIKSKDRRQTYCSHRCAKVSNKHRLTHGKFAERPCPVCGETFKPSSQRGGTFQKTCSIQCGVTHRYETTIEAWLAEPRSRDNPRGDVPPYIKRWLIEQHGDESCWECGWAKPNPTTGNVMVQVDHIDGDPTNNHPNNLRRLCPNCHSITPNWGVHGKVDVEDSNTDIRGVYGYAKDSTVASHGVYGRAGGSDDVYGVYGNAHGSHLNYGVYGRAATAGWSRSSCAPVS